jgi:hypothetical protein
LRIPILGHVNNNLLDLGNPNISNRYVLGYRIVNRFAGTIYHFGQLALAGLMPYQK